MDQVEGRSVEPATRGHMALAASRPFRLTDRDVEILRFLHEQSFASLGMLYFRFFDKQRKSPSDPVPENMWVARQRVATLRRAGLITTQRVFTDAKALYLLTRQGYELLETRLELKLDAEPVKEIDFRYFEHDKRVTMSRVAFERDNVCLRWYPDRLLRRKQGFPYGDDAGRYWQLPKRLIPDGVFINARHERVAVEVELTQKSFARVREKVIGYRKLMAEREQGRGPVFSQVMLVACMDRIGKDLQELGEWDERVKVMSYEKLVGGILGVEALRV